MNILKILFLLSLSKLSFKMTAQVGDLLKNKDITWIAESCNDFTIDASFENKISEVRNISIALKLTNRKEETLDEKFVIQKWLMESVENGETTIYSDSNCTKKISLQDISNWAIFCQIDVNTNESKVVKCFDKFQPEQIFQFRARQIFSYNVKKARFEMQTLAIAPLYNFGEYDLESDQFKRNYKPIFWFKPKDLNKTQRLSKKNIIWARRMSFINGISIDADSVKILKNTQNTTPMNHLLATFKTNPDITFYRQEKSNPTQKIDFRERKTMFVSRDTIVHWKDNNTKPQFEIINNDLTASELVRLQLHQNWYWNSRKKRLEIRLIAAAPMKEVFFLNTFSYSLPVFYRRTDD